MDALRVTLRQRRRTKHGRAASDYGSKRCPIEEADALARLVTASEGAPRAVHLATMLLLDWAFASAKSTDFAG